MRDYSTATVRPADGEASSSAAVLGLRQAGPSSYVDLVVPASGATFMRLHRRVTVLLSSSVDGVALEGTVTAVSRHDEGLRCQIQTKPEASRELGQRQAFRVRPALTAPVRARIVEPALAVEAHARDVSASGICLGIPASAEEKLADLWCIGVDLLLPEQEREFPLRIDIIRRFADGPTVAIAGRFLWPSPHGTSEAERAIFQYVMHRQREDPEPPE